MKTYRKLRQITNDSRRNSIMFYNEIFEQTKLLRIPNESSFRRDWKALCQLAHWYDTHLKHEKKIILLSESPHDTTTTSENVVVMTMKQYLDAYYRDNKLLQNLIQVLADVVLEENEQDQSKIKITSNKHNAANSDAAVSGYTEVFLLYMEKTPLERVFFIYSFHDV